MTDVFHELLRLFIFFASGFLLQCFLGDFLSNIQYYELKYSDTRIMFEYCDVIDSAHMKPFLHAPCVRCGHILLNEVLYSNTVAIKNVTLFFSYKSVKSRPIIIIAIHILEDSIFVTIELTYFPHHLNNVSTLPCKLESRAL